MTLTRWLTAATATLATIPVHGAPKAADQERLLYIWSENAELIVEGSIAAFETVDDPQARSPYFEATVRINTVQRGNPGAGTIRVRIEDPLQLAIWGDRADELGARGLWFLYRVQAPVGEVPFGHLIRYLSVHEIASDPAAADKLMRFVIEDTVDHAIATDILKVLEPNPKGSTQTIDLRLHYDADGTLKDLEILRNSGNALYDQHVFDQAAALHRVVRPSILVTDVDVRITRSQAAVDPRKERRRRSTAATR